MASLPPERYEGKVKFWHDNKELVSRQIVKMGIIFERSHLGSSLGFGTALEYLVGDKNHISFSEKAKLGKITINKFNIVEGRYFVKEIGDVGSIVSVMYKAFDEAERRSVTDKGIALERVGKRLLLLADIWGKHKENRRLLLDAVLHYDFDQNQDKNLLMQAEKKVSFIVAAIFSHSEIQSSLDMFDKFFPPVGDHNGLKRSRISYEIPVSRLRRALEI